MKNKSFLIIGYFGYVDGQIDGQTLKTRNVYRLFKDMSARVTFFDTQSLKNERFSYFKLLWLILFSKNIVLLPGKNNLAKLFVILDRIASLMRKDIFVFAVGGWLSEFLKGNKAIEARFKNVKHIFVESESMKMRLINQNLLLSSRISKFPNFRITSYVPQVFSDSAIFRIIFVARITELKGCDLVFEFLDFYKNNRRQFAKEIEVNFYGPIDDVYSSRFSDNLERFSEFAFYRGVVPAEDVYNVIGRHDVTVLPTYYPGEGFPGTIIDSYLAGVPVIVSKWKDIPEFVVPEETGFIFDLNKLEDFFFCIQNLVNNEDLLKKMKIRSVEYSKLYSVDEAKRVLRTVFL